MVEFFLRGSAALREKGCFLLSVRGSGDLAPPDSGFDFRVIQRLSSVARGAKEDGPRENFLQSFPAVLHFGCRLVL